MRWSLERVRDEGPSFEPVDLDEIKTRLGVTNSGRDVDIQSLITSARVWAENFTGRALVDQQWRLTVGSYLGSATTPAGVYSGDYRPLATGEILLRRSPVLAVVSVSSFDGAGTETVEDDALFEVRGADSKWPTLYPLTGASWGSGELRIVFRAGYADTTSSPQEDATAIPECFKQAIKLHVEAHFDRNPENRDWNIAAAKALLRDERCELGIA